MRSALRTLPAVLVLALGLVHCKSMAERARQKAEEKAIERQTGGQVKVDEGNITITTDAGTFAMGAGAKLPDDFPKSVPVYPGATVQMAVKSSGANGKPAWTATFESPDDRDKVIAYYKAHMSGFKEATDMAMGDSHMSVWQSPEYDATLMIGSGGPKETSITLTVAGK